MERHKPFSKQLNDYEGKRIFDSRIENIDTAMYKFIDEQMNLHTNSPSGMKKVPILMVSAERVALSKKDSRVRDADGALIMPLITIERTSMTKSPSEKGTVWANIPSVDKVKGGSIPVMQKMVQGKTANFKNAHTLRKRGQLNFPDKTEKTVYKTVSIPLPVYVTVMYQITIRTEYQQQMNDLVVPFMTVPGGINYIIIRDGVHRYEGFIQQEYSHENNISNFSNEERKFETKFDIKVLGHLIGSGINQETPHKVVNETIVEVKIPRERSVVDPEELAKYGL
tara:strand:+ start:672 stop:1517 length:846 start_codon:yes stop_codon:yes gene_type:complete